MFLPARFIVIDDKREHLEAIVESLAASGTPCHAIRYDIENEIRPDLFKGLRALFMDLQLQSDIPSSSYSQHFATIQTILEGCILREAGPFIMMLWTDRPEHSEELARYLLTNIHEDMAHCRPLKIIALSKNDFIDTTTGKLRDGETSGKALRSAIHSNLSDVPSLAAMMQWEAEIALAAGEVLSDLMDVAGSIASRPQTPNQVSSSPEASMADALKQLASASMGSAYIGENLRLGIHDVLLPMLNDRIYNLKADHEAAGIWGRAFDDSTENIGRMPGMTVATLNRRIHFEMAKDNEKKDSSSWGAVSGVPDSFDWKAVGLSNAEEMLSVFVQGFKKSVSTETANLVQVRIGASCDYAQQKSGPVTFVLGGLFPCTDSKPWDLKANNNSWISPMFEFAHKSFQLVVNPRFVYTTDQQSAQSYKFCFRLREQLLMELISRISFHSSRPGIVRFDP